MDLRLQIFASGAALLLLVVVFELVRRKQLLERYALLWLFSALVLLLLAVWRQLLSGVADAIGIYYPPSALFAVAFAFVLLLLLHFSLAVSRLTDQSKVLAQRQALLEERLREREHAEALARVAPARHGNGEHQPNGEPGGNGERRVRSSSRHTSDQ